MWSWVISTFRPGSKESSTGLAGKWTNAFNNNRVYLRKWIRWLIAKRCVCFRHFVLPWRSQQNVASCDDALSSLVLLSTDLASKITNTCNNNHVGCYGSASADWLECLVCIWGHRFCGIWRQFTWINCIFPFVIHLAECATMWHILLAATEFRPLALSKHYCQPRLWLNNIPYLKQ